MFACLRNKPTCAAVLILTTRGTTESHLYSICVCEREREAEREREREREIEEEESRAADDDLSTFKDTFYNLGFNVL